MKIIHIIFLLLFIKNINCCYLNNTILFCEESKCTFEVSKGFGSPYEADFNLTKINDNLYSYDVANLPGGNILLQSTKDCIFFSHGAEVPSNTALEVPSYGGNVSFKGAFMVDDQGYFMSFFINGKAVIPDEVLYDTDTNLYTITRFPPGCGKFTFERRQGDVFYSGSYSKPKAKINENKNIISVEGLNLYNPYLIISGSSSLNVNASYIDEKYQNANFTFNDGIYCGKWKIVVNVCGNQVANKTIIYQPKKINIGSVPGGTGGIVTIKGDYLYSRTIDKDPSDFSGYFIRTYKDDKDLSKNATYKICTVTGFDKDTNSITCNMPGVSDNEKKKNLLLYVTVDGYSGSTNFSYDAPTITNVIQTSFPTEGYASFAIEGKHFLNNSIVNITVKVPDKNGVPHDKNINYKIINDSYIEANVPVNAFPGYITIISTEVGEPVYSPYDGLLLHPIVNSISNCNSTGGYVTIKGTSLNTYSIGSDGKKTNIPININIKDIDTISCDEPTSLDGLSIICKMGTGVGLNLPLTIEIGDYFKNNSLKFSYNQPYIDDIVQYTNGTANIIGNNFGSNKKKLSIVYNEKNYFSIIDIKDTSLLINIPINLTGYNELKLTAGSPGFESSMGFEFVVKPIILEINSIPTSGGNVTIKGEHLTSEAAISFRARRGSPRGIPCRDIKVSNDNKVLVCSVNGISSLAINQTTNAGELLTTSGKNHHIFMSIKGRNAFNEKNLTFSFEPPKIYYSPGKQEYSSTILVVGDNFNRVGLNVTIGGRKCKYPFVQRGFDVIQCSLDNIPDDDKYQYVNKTFRIEVWVDGQYGFLDKNFTYTFDNNNFSTPSNKVVWMIPAVGICGLIGISTILAITIYYYKRYIRLRTIKEILNKKEYQQQ